jgi:hypothetical protein
MNGWLVLRVPQDERAGTPARQTTAMHQSLELTLAMIRYDHRLARPWSASGRAGKNAGPADHGDASGLRADFGNDLG